MIKGLPKKLLELRGKYGYSQRQVAELIGVSPSLISGYENGDRTPSINVLISLSYVYKCSTDYLLGKTESQPEMALDVSGLTPEQIQFVKTFISMIEDK